MAAIKSIQWKVKSILFSTNVFNNKLLNNKSFSSSIPCNGIKSNFEKPVSIIRNKKEALLAVNPRRYDFCGTLLKTSYANFHSTARRSHENLLQFFDDKENYGKDSVKCGRSWNKDELRLKSNSDLHKLWYVLLKEKNMLLTMEYACKKEAESFPNPERIDKVQDSMINLEQIVMERNRAYFQLETGETGERKVYMRRDLLGLDRRYAEVEHVIPVYMNRKYYARHLAPGGGRAVGKFKRLFEEKERSKKFQSLRRKFNLIKSLLKRFPDITDEVLEKNFPEMDIPKIRHHFS